MVNNLVTLLKAKKDLESYNRSDINLLRKHLKLDSNISTNDLLWSITLKLHYSKVKGKMDNETEDSFKLEESYHPFSYESDLESLPPELLDQIRGELYPKDLKSFRETSYTLAHKGYDDKYETYKRGDIEDAIKKGYIDTVKRLLEKKKYTIVELNKFLEIAARNGHRDLVDFFISKGADDWNWGMRAAAEGGHRDLVEFFINEKGARDWNWGMRAAARSGHRDLVDFFISTGADDWNGGMFYADRGGHRDLVEFFINEKGAGDWE